MSEARLRPTFLPDTAMAIHDPSLLSAYIDDELDEHERALVELAAAGDASVHSEIEALRGVSRAFDNLPRPAAPRDVSLEVKRRLEQLGIEGRKPKNRRGERTASWLAIGGLSAVAASLLLVWVTHTLDRTPNQAPRLPLLPRVGNALANNNPAPAATDTSSPTPGVEATPTEIAAADTRVHDQDDPIGELQRIGDQVTLSALLDGPEVQRLNLTLASLDPRQLQRIEEILKSPETGLGKHAKLTLSGELTGGTGGSGEAVVYVLPLRPAQARELCKRIEAGFPDAGVLASEPVEPQLRDSLATAREFSIREGEPRSPMLPEPPTGALPLDRLHATRDDAPPAERVVAPVVPRPLPSRLPSTASSPPAPAAAQAAASSTDDRVVYLLWLTARPAPSE